MNNYTRPLHCPFHPHSAAPLETTTKLCCLHRNLPAGPQKHKVGQLNFSFMLLTCYGMKWKGRGCQGCTSLFCLSLTKPASYLRSLLGVFALFLFFPAQQPSLIAARRGLSSNKVVDDEVWSSSQAVIFVISVSKCLSKKIVKTATFIFRDPFKTRVEMKKCCNWKSLCRTYFRDNVLKIKDQIFSVRNQLILPPRLPNHRRRCQGGCQQVLFDGRTASGHPTVLYSTRTMWGQTRTHKHTSTGLRLLEASWLLKNPKHASLPRHRLSCRMSSYTVRPKCLNMFI